MNRTTYNPNLISIMSLKVQFEEKHLNLNDEYQIENMWNRQMKEDLIESIFMGMPIGSAMVWDGPNGKEVIDGLQRISTILEFMNSEFTLSPSQSKAICKMFSKELSLENTTMSKKYVRNIEENKNFRLKYSNLPLMMKNIFDIYQFLVIEIRGVDINTLRNYFIKVQNQESLKAGEIVRSIPENDFIKKISEYSSEEIFKSFGFYNRKEMIKILVMLHGVFEGKLSFNAPDIKIRKYASGVEKANSVFISRLETFRKLLNNEYKGNIIFKQKGEMKLLLLSIFLTDLMNILDINKLVKAVKYFSDEAKILSSNSPEKNWLKRGLKKERSEFFDVATIQKGQHTSKRVKELMPHYKNALLEFSEMRK